MSGQAERPKCERCGGQGCASCYGTGLAAIVHNDHANGTVRASGTFKEHHSREHDTPIGRVIVTHRGHEPHRPPTVRIARSRHRAPRKLIIRRRGGSERRPGRRASSASRTGSGGGSSGPDGEPAGEPHAGRAVA